MIKIHGERVRILDTPFILSNHQTLVKIYKITYKPQNISDYSKRKQTDRVTTSGKLRTT
jgi:hypothetical protein